MSPAQGSHDWRRTTTLMRHVKSKSPLLAKESERIYGLCEAIQASCKKKKGDEEVEEAQV